MYVIGIIIVHKIGIIINLHKRLAYSYRIIRQL